MRTTFTVLVFIWLLPLIHVESQQTPQTPNAIPMIRLDKTRFALGESVFFWVGVKQTNRAPIPKQYQKTCRLTIMHPDGSQKTEEVSWPIDGPADSGWLGGSGLGTDKIQPGQYTLVFEFAGQQTAPTFIFVEDVPILKQIETSFTFGQLRDDPASFEAHVSPTESVTLIVHNGSDQTLRFPRRDGTNGLVSVSIRKVDGSYSNSFFYPDGNLLGQKEPEMPSISFDKFTWDIAQKVPTIILKPGETYRQGFSLKVAFDESKRTSSYAPGEYKVTFGTNLQILVGEKDGMWAEFSPIRTWVYSTATCNITQ
jgi:hypothetical protein